MKTLAQGTRFVLASLASASLVAASIASAAIYSNGSKTANFDVTLTVTTCI